MKIIPVQAVSCIVFIFTIVVFSTFFCLGFIALFLPLSMGVWSPGSKFAAIVVGGTGVGVSVYSFIKVLRNENIFYFPSERHQYYELSFDVSKTLTIEPLHEIEDKTIVVKVRWRPQPKSTPHVASFRLYLKRPVEPKAIFQVLLIGKRNGKERVIDKQTIEQKIDLAPPVQHAERDAVYEDWREVSFNTKERFPEYKFEINIDVSNDYADALEENITQRIWIDMFVALKLSEVQEFKKKRAPYSMSNINDVLFSVRDSE